MPEKLLMFLRRWAMLTLLCCTCTAVVRAHAAGRQRLDTGEVKKLLSLAAANITTDVAKEFYYANEALIFSEKAKWETGIMYAHRYLGDCYNRVMAYNDAIQHFNIAIATAKHIGRQDVETLCMKLLLHAYHELNIMDSVLVYQSALVTMAMQTGNVEDECAQMRAYGLFLSDAGRYRDAVNWLHKTIAYTEAHLEGNKGKEKVADMMNILAGALIKIEGSDSAIYYLRVAARLAAETGNRSLIAYIKSTFCDVYAANGRFDSAIIYGEETVRMGEEQANLDLQQYYCKMLSRIYENAGNPGRALLYMKRYDSLINIINNTQKTIAEAIQVAKIGIEQQAERSRQEKKAMETTRRNEQAALVLALTTLGAVVLMTISIYRNLRQKQRANVTISMQAEHLKEQNEVIDKALKEKEDLLRELHHRVKNNLQLISGLLELQAAGQANTSVKDALHAAQRRVLSIATVHSKLYGNNENTQIDLPAFTNDLFLRLNSAFSKEDKQVDFQNTIPAVQLPLGTVVLLGLILNELITNSFKHAFAHVAKPVISIGFERANGTCRLLYHDNGGGLPDGLFAADSSTLGLQLVKRLSKQLKGHATYHFENGSTFTIIFPDAGSENSNSRG